MRDRFSAVPEGIGIKVRVSPALCETREDRYICMSTKYIQEPIFISSWYIFKNIFVVFLSLLDSQLSNCIDLKT